MDFLSKKHLLNVSHTSCESEHGFSPITTNPPLVGHYSGSSFPIIATIVIGMFATSFLLMGYYIFVIKCCLNWNSVDLVRIRRFSLSRRFEEPSAAQSSHASEHRGLEEAVIRLIPVIHYKTEEGDTESGERSFCECAVCLNEFQQDEKLRVIPNCSHVFHIDCVDVWLQNNANCPLCRRSISLTSEVQVDHQLLTPRPSPQDQRQNVEGCDEDFVVIDLDNEHDGDQHLQERQGQELELPTGPIGPLHWKLEQRILQKKAKQLQKVTSMGDECIGNRDKDDGFSVQTIRRSFSMDSSEHRKFYLTVQLQQNGHVHEASSIEVSGASSDRAKISCFSFGHGSRSRSAVLPVYLDP
ncbi:Zinc finger, RING-type [Sesbania bispinosa]|nr:Zinc finger, RING-type [Sesbania bispinosa]